MVLGFIIPPYRAVSFKALNSATDNAASCKKRRPVNFYILPKRKGQSI
jgi:hypothetical protein